MRDIQPTNNRKVVVLISITSDIGTALAKRYATEGYIIIGTYRSTDKLNELKKIPNCHTFFCDIDNKNSVSKFIKNYKDLGLRWDIFISCPGTLRPIGNFFTCNFNQWSDSIHVNVIEQLRILHRLYQYRNEDTTSKIIFFAGSGTNSAPRNYSAYTLSKIMLIKMCELLDAENEDISTFIIGPGWVKTKIHNETIAESEKTASPIYNKTVDFLKSGKGTSMDEIYECIMWLSKQEKMVVSGRNFSVEYDKWKGPLNKELLRELNSDSDMYKLRRYKNNFLQEL